jgi:hypothetical protein
MQAAIFQRLSTYVAVMDLVGDRIYPTKAPQDEPLPCIIYRRFGDQAPQMQSGACGIAEAQYEISVIATCAKEATDVSEAIRNAFDGLRNVEIGTTYVRSANLINESDTSILFQGSEDERYQIEMDFDFWYFRSVPTL